jgi:hypothetical protein
VLISLGVEWSGSIDPAHVFTSSRLTDIRDSTAGSLLLHTGAVSPLVRLSSQSPTPIIPIINSELR